MTPKERAIAALTLKTPDMVPEFELGFYLEEEMFGRKFITEELEPKNLANMSMKDKEKNFTSWRNMWFMYLKALSTALCQSQT